MVTRRGFLSGLLAVGALAGAGIRMPEREEIEFDATPYLTSKDAWYLPDWPGRYSNRLSTPTDLSAKCIEDVLNQIRDNEVLSSLHIRPTKLIVPPNLAKRAEYVLTHRPTLFERLWWNITSMAA